MKHEINIGEVAKMHNIPIATLRYYDEIGVFMPSRVNQTTGYRYYCPEQFEKLNTINYLKYLGLSLKSIKHHLESGDEQNLLKLLREQQEVNIQEIKRMSLIGERFDKRIQEIEDALQVKEVGKVFIKRLPSRRTLCTKKTITNRDEMEISLKYLENKSFKSSSIFIGMVGLTVSQSALENEIFWEYNAIFILPEENVENSPFVKIIKEGEYVCIYYREAFGKSQKYYHQLMEYIKENDYKIIGNAVERIIVDSVVTKNKSKHLSEIQIPIKRPAVKHLSEILR
ncbi:MAG TPA: MerR family transcriptional regulator [Clostridium sp.]|uniref:MerR family transcriptional regulator n=1 Tax=Clostridium sp. TaxID=1506 RepID=UPI002F927C3A